MSDLGPHGVCPVTLDGADSPVWSSRYCGMSVIFPTSPILFPVASSIGILKIGLMFFPTIPPKPCLPNGLTLLPRFSHSPAPGVVWNCDRYESITSSCGIAGLIPAGPHFSFHCGP